MPLPIFFVVTKLAHSLRVPPLAVWLLGAALEIAHIHTGATVIDEFASRFVYFYSGYLFAPHIFALAARWRDFPEGILAGLAIWGMLNGLLVEAQPMNPARCSFTEPTIHTEPTAPIHRTDRTEPTDHTDHT